MVDVTCVMLDVTCVMLDVTCVMLDVMLDDMCHVGCDVMLVVHVSCWM